MGSDESHFNVSWLWGIKSQVSVHRLQLLKRKESRSGIEPRSLLPLTSLVTPYRLAKPGGSHRSHGPVVWRLYHFVLRSQKWGGLLGTGGGGGGRKSEGSTADIARKRPEKPWTEQNVTMRQALRRLVAALRNCCFNCRAWAELQGQCPMHCCWGTTRSERSPTFAAQLHLHTHDLFWANLRVQLHLHTHDLFWANLKVQLHLSPSSKISWSFAYHLNSKLRSWFQKPFCPYNKSVWH